MIDEKVGDTPTNLDELFDHKTPDYDFDEISWGDVQGDEVW